VLHSATKYFNPSLTASYIYRIHFKLQHSKFWMWLSFLWSFQFWDFKPHFVHLTGVLHFTTLTVAKIIQCQCQMNERVWSIGRLILTGKNQNTPRKTWPSATLSTTNPIQTGLHGNPGVCGERSRTNSQSHLPMVAKVIWECFLLYRSVLMCCTACSMCYK